MKRATLLSLVFALAAIPALAGQKIVLSPPDVRPNNLKAWGIAMIEVRGGAESFHVRADAALKDGSILVVSIKRREPTQSDNWIDIAKAPVILGTALVSLNSKEHVSPAFPVKGLSDVRVSYRGQTILSGHF